MAWGYLTSIDLFKCNPDLIRSEEHIKAYVRALIELIDMKAYGECQVVHFGSCEAVEGFTMMQMIETSLISGHFVNVSNEAYIDIFSCKPYDAPMAASFTAYFFKAKDYNYEESNRGR